MLPSADGLSPIFEDRGALNSFDRKTITTIAVAGVLFQQGKIKRMLVVAPKSIVEVWRQEFDKFAAFPYSVVVLDGDSGKKADTIRHMSGSGLQVIVVNYESCWRLDNVIVKWQPNMIVCDESSKIKNIDNIDQQIIAIQEEVLTLHRQKQRLAITEEDYQKRLAAFGEQMKELEEQRKQDRTAENRYAAMRLWLDEFKEHTESGDFMNDADGSIMKALGGGQLLP